MLSNILSTIFTHTLSFLPFYALTFSSPHTSNHYTHSLHILSLASILTLNYTLTCTLPHTHPTHLVRSLSLSLQPLYLPLTYLSQIIDALAAVEGVHWPRSGDSSRGGPVVSGGREVAAGGLLQQEDDWVGGRIAQ